MVCAFGEGQTPPAPLLQGFKRGRITTQRPPPLAAKARLHWCPPLAVVALCPAAATLLRRTGSVGAARKQIHMANKSTNRRATHQAGAQTAEARVGQHKDADEEDYLSGFPPPPSASQTERPAGPRSAPRTSCAPAFHTSTRPLFRRLPSPNPRKGKDTDSEPASNATAIQQLPGEVAKVSQHGKSKRQEDRGANLFTRLLGHARLCLRVKA